MSEQVFVARERELAQLQSFLDRALAGQGQVCFVTGEAGAGKPVLSVAEVTALLTDTSATLSTRFAPRAQDAHPDLIVAVGQGDAQTGIGDPYRSAELRRSLPFREILAQLTGDVELQCRCARPATPWSPTTIPRPSLRRGQPST